MRRRSAVGDWDVYLAGHGVPVMADDISRPAVARSAARMLIAEQHEREARRRAKAAKVERAAVEQDRQWRRQLHGGIPASAIPHGMTYGQAVASAELDGQAYRPRASVVEDLLSNDGSLTFHPIHSTPAEEWVVTVPDPLATDAKVIVDSAERTLIVKPKVMTGHAALLWRQGHRDLVKAEEAGRYGETVWAHGAGRREISRGEPAEDGSLRFKFRRGDPAYKELVGTPMSAVIVVDSWSSSILSVKFRHRREPWRRVVIWLKH
jgi:hypothetical protein